MKNLAYILLFIPFGILSQNIDFTAKASKNKIVIGEPSTITLEFKFPANQLIDSVEFQLSSSGDSLGNNWELWDKSILEKILTKKIMENFLFHLLRILPLQILILAAILSLLVLLFSTLINCYLIL